jgi:sn-2 palmitoyl-lipid 9-desaturase
MLWLFYPAKESFDPQLYCRWAPDLAKDGYYRWLDKYYLLLQVPATLLLFAIGGWSWVIYGVQIDLKLVSGIRMG